MKQRETKAQRRARLKQMYGELFDNISYILIQRDPIGLIGAGAPLDEYELEVGSILPRLQEAHTIDELSLIVHQEFVRWFDASTAGAQVKYTPIAAEIWPIWQDFKLHEGTA